MDRRKLTVWAVVIVVAAILGYLVSRPAPTVMKNVDNAQAQKLIDSGVRLVDVRTAQEFSAGHIAGAENVPVDQLPSAAASWPKNQPVLVYCATGARSLTAAEWMSKNGFRTVYNLTAGIVQWDGQTTTEAAAAPKSVPTNGKPVFIEFSSST